MTVIPGHRLRHLAPLLGGLALLACQEQLAAPADCPALCPGGYDIRDTVLQPVPGGDSSFAGYLTIRQAGSLRVSWNFPPSEDRAVIRFAPRRDSVVVGVDTLPYTIDSVSVAFSVLARDTAVKNLYVYLYRLPTSVDSTVTFIDVDTAFTVANLVDSFLVDDTLRSQRITRIYKGATLPMVDIPPADTGVLAVGVQIRAASGTGIRLGGLGSGGDIPSVATYITVPTTDTALQHQTLRSVPLFTTFVSATNPAPAPDELTVGGVPSVRSLVRFPWPAYLRDTAQLLRVTLELVPLAPVPGLPGDTAFVLARPLLADLGSKSPPVGDASFIQRAAIPAGFADTVRWEVRRAVTTWQGSQPLPPAFLLQLSPEVSNFTTARFGSTRTPGFVPQLRITYARPFPFQEP